VKKGEYFEVPDGIIARLAMECNGNVHGRHLIDVRSGSFEYETDGNNPCSGAYYDYPQYAAKNAADLKARSVVVSAYRHSSEEIRHTKNNWLCFQAEEDCAN
jgi:hypothetical protein